MNKLTKTEIQDAAINSLPLKPHGLLNYTVRFGKGRVVCELIKKNQPKKILWVTVNTDLRDVDIPKEIKLWLGEEHLEKFNIVCYQSLHNVTGHYDMIILDEYQHITKRNMANLLSGSITYEYITGITGTPPKHFHKKQILLSLYLTELDSMSIDEGVENGIVAPYKITTVPVKLNDTLNIIKAGSKDKPFYTTEKKNYDFWNKKILEKEEKGEDQGFLRIKRANIVQSSISKVEATLKLLNTLEGRTMVFSGSIEQSEAISKYTYNSKTDDTNYKLFKEGKINVLSCVNKGGIGNTYEGVENFIIVQVNTNKMGDITQKIGRALLEQGSRYKANIYLVYLQDTVDEQWKNKVLQDFNSDNIVELPKI